MEAVRNQLRKLRVAKDWTQEELAQAAAVSLATISRLERGERRPSPLVAHRIAKALGVPEGAVWPEDLQEAS